MRPTSLAEFEGLTNSDVSPDFTGLKPGVVVTSATTLVFANAISIGWTTETGTLRVVACVTEDAPNVNCRRARARGASCPAILVEGSSGLHDRAASDALGETKIGLTMGVPSLITKFG